jgi:hypothetical protein
VKRLPNNATALEGRNRFPTVIVVGFRRWEGNQMGITKSFIRYGQLPSDDRNFQITIPSAIISDGIVTIPLYAVTAMSLNQTYHLPPIGSSKARAVVATHDDTITLNGMLVGAERFAWKFALETLAEASKRGSALASFTGGKVSGLILLTSMTIRTDMHVQSLSFSASAGKRDVLDVSINMAHMPLPGALGKLLDAVSVGVASLADWAGN